MSLFPLNYYFKPENPLEGDLEELASPGLDYKKDNQKVNDLSMNVALKYLIRYLKLEGHEIHDTRSRISIILDQKAIRLKRWRSIMQGGWVNFKEFRKSDEDFNDIYPLTCLADIRTTAAIFKEIAFNPDFEKEKQFRGIDLGSGTGILMLGVWTAARRAQIKNILVQGVEINPYTANRAQETLTPIMGGQGEVLQGDVSDFAVFKNLLEDWPLHYWASETISNKTPPLDLEKKDLGLSGDQEIEEERKSEMFNDPYPEALLNTLAVKPDFFQEVRAKKIAMFPDQPNGRYRPNYMQSSIVLRTGTKTPLPLSRLSLEFKDYQDLNIQDSRWL